jgi:hypothetical protein
MKKDKLILFFILILTTMFSIYGCSSPSRSRSVLHSQYSVKGNLVSIGYHVADRLISNLKQPINSGDSIVVATFVKIDDLNKSSTFGRVITRYNFCARR